MIIMYICVYIYIYTYVWYSILYDIISYYIMLYHVTSYYAVRPPRTSLLPLCDHEAPDHLLTMMPGWGLAHPGVGRRGRTGHGCTALAKMAVALLYLWVWYHAEPKYLVLRLMHLLKLHNNNDNNDTTTTTTTNNYYYKY